MAMVAAHSGDLEGAVSLSLRKHEPHANLWQRKVGLRTIFVERPGEETLTEEKLAEARKWVDIWIGQDEGGFEELARRLGVCCDHCDLS